MTVSASITASITGYSMTVHSHMYFRYWRKYFFYDIHVLCCHHRRSISLDGMASSSFGTGFHILSEPVISGMVGQWVTKNCTPDEPSL